MSNVDICCKWMNVPPRWCDGESCPRHLLSIFRLHSHWSEFRFILTPETCWGFWMKWAHISFIRSILRGDPMLTIYIRIFLWLYFSRLISVWSAKHEGFVVRLIDMRNNRASVQQGARITMHQRTKQIMIADKMLLQRTCDVADCRRRRPTILFNLNSAIMYQLLSIFMFYSMFATHNAVVAADNQPDVGGGGNHDIGFTAGPEGTTTPFGECFPYFPAASLFGCVFVSLLLIFALRELQMRVSPFCGVTNWTWHTYSYSLFVLGIRNRFGAIKLTTFHCNSFRCECNAALAKNRFQLFSCRHWWLCLRSTRRTGWNIVCLFVFAPFVFFAKKNAWFETGWSGYEAWNWIID